jgi:hypothetical protein
MKKLISVGTAIVVVLALGAGCASQSATQQSVDQAAASKAAKVSGKKHHKKQSGLETASQANARQAAENYLSFAPFSRQGLIDQLSSKAGDGYSKADATYAADAVHADWNKQAALAAKNYLKTMPFSKNELIQQLESKAGDGYTHAQAVYGVSKTGL